MPRKIAVVTGTRAEYGILYWVMREIQARPSLELQLLVTGAHLSPEFGLTFRQIEEDGFPISEKLEILLSADSASAVSTSIGLGTIAFAKAYERLAPDLLLLLGDRFESLAAAIAALVARIPIAHISGGQSTQGVIDEAIRHSITKMSYLHFTGNSSARDRVVQLGEHPDRVFVTGTPSLDGIRQMRLWDRSELEHRLGLDLSRPFLLVSYHPVTLETNTASWQMDQLLEALAGIDRQCLFLMPNADTGGRVIVSKIKEFVDRSPCSTYFGNLERDLYLNLMKRADAMIGNSSSAFAEAPSFDLPVVNIGDRQRGRIRAENVIDCDYDSASITRALERALDPTFKESVRALPNPYGDGNSSERIVDILERVELGSDLLKKKFFDVSLSGVSL